MATVKAPAVGSIAAAAALAAQTAFDLDVRQEEDVDVGECGDDSLASQAQRKKEEKKKPSKASVAAAASSSQVAVEEGPPELFCFCQQPDDGSNMIGCDECESWYHFDCVGVSEEEAALLTQWVCPLCQSKKDTQADEALVQRMAREEHARKLRVALARGDVVAVQALAQTTTLSVTEQQELARLEADIAAQPVTSKAAADDDDDDDDDESMGVKRPLSKKRSRSESGMGSSSSSSTTSSANPTTAYTMLPNEHEAGMPECVATPRRIRHMQRDEIVRVMADLRREITMLEHQLLQQPVPKDKLEEDEEEEAEQAKAAEDPDVWKCPEHAVPICTDVREFDWERLAKEKQKATGRLFDVIVMDPPWVLSSANPTRGVAIAYSTLCDNDITDIPIPKLQTDGFIFIWVINYKYDFTLQLMQSWGYEYVDEVSWVKMTVNRRLAKGHGFYLQHAKETVLIGFKGKDPPGCASSIVADVIYGQRRGQSQKPETLYELIENLVPGGHFIEIFGRRNNMRSHWVTMGNEL